MNNNELRSNATFENQGRNVRESRTGCRYFRLLGLRDGSSLGRQVFGFEGTPQRALTVLFNRKKRGSLGKTEWPLFLPNTQMELGPGGRRAAWVHGGHRG